MTGLMPNGGAPSAVNDVLAPARRPPRGEQLRAFSRRHRWGLSAYAPGLTGIYLVLDIVQKWRSDLGGFWARVGLLAATVVVLVARYVHQTWWVCRAERARLRTMAGEWARRIRDAASARGYSDDRLAHLADLPSKRVGYLLHANGTDPSPVESNALANAVGLSEVYLLESLEYLPRKTEHALMRLEANRRWTAELNAAKEAAVTVAGLDGVSRGGILAGALVAQSRKLTGPGGAASLHLEALVVPQSRGGKSPVAFSDYVFVRPLAQEERLGSLGTEALRELVASCASTVIQSTSAKWENSTELISRTLPGGWNDQLVFTVPRLLAARPVGRSPRVLRDGSRFPASIAVLGGQWSGAPDVAALIAHVLGWAFFTVENLVDEAYGRSSEGHDHKHALARSLEALVLDPAGIGRQHVWACEDLAALRQLRTQIRDGCDAGDLLVIALESSDELLSYATARRQGRSGAASDIDRSQHDAADQTAILAAGGTTRGTRRGWYERSVGVPSEAADGSDAVDAFFDNYVDMARDAYEWLCQNYEGLEAQDFDERLRQLTMPATDRRWAEPPITSAAERSPARRLTWATATERELVTLVDNGTACISSSSGDILPPGTWTADYGSAGFFVRDTRLCSMLELRINGTTPTALAPTIAATPYQAEFRSVLMQGDANEGLRVERRRHLDGRLVESITLKNELSEVVTARLTLLVETDFADVSEIRQFGSDHLPPPTATHIIKPDSTYVQISRPVPRSTPQQAFIAFSKNLAAEVLGDSRVRLSAEVRLPPRSRWNTTVVIGKGEPSSTNPVDLTIDSRHRRWEADRYSISASERWLDDLLGRSVQELSALRLHDTDAGGSTLAAGAPWFLTLFGRDSLLASWMAMIVDPLLAVSTLKALAHHQGRASDVATEEQPGKILHELRVGRQDSHWLPRPAYYGTIDSTPLFVALLGEVDRWGVDRQAVDQLITAADFALEMLERDASADKMGFLRYDTTDVPQRLRNQGWKDSRDGIQFSDGTLARGKIALCEVQGYYYAALIGRAEIARARGSTDVADQFEKQARELKEQFNEKFWIPRTRRFALALDGENQQVDAVASNVGHCLWSGIVNEDLARFAVQTLLSPELFSGHGIRTLASNMVGYNPSSYHCGSVWPHDTAIAVAGLARYGYRNEASTVASGLMAAACKLNRLPELFTGSSDVDGPMVGHSPCYPQAWAAAAPFLMLRALLGFEVTHGGVMSLAPNLPSDWGEITIENLRLGTDTVGFRARAGARTA